MSSKQDQERHYQERPQKEALLYERLDGGVVQCGVCAHRCRIPEGKCGACHVRLNRAGKLYSLVYGRLVAASVDPIEKKPLYHVLPGTRAYSIATAGCNFHCRWCQNWEISQMPRDEGRIVGETVAPEEVVRHARASGCASISYTYTEPTVFIEFALDTAREAHAAGLKNSFVTNGYMSSQALELVAPYLDAANVDLKAFNEETYATYMGARLSPVLDTLRAMKRRGIWVEVTTLLVRGVNDDLEELERAAAFIAGELGTETPWHISRSHPAYRMGALAPTPAARLEQARGIGERAGLSHVYLGNVAAETPTRCASCGEILIRREGFRVISHRTTAAGLCPCCGTPLAGVGMGCRAADPAAETTHEAQQAKRKKGEGSR